MVVEEGQGGIGIRPRSAFPPSVRALSSLDRLSLTSPLLSPRLPSSARRLSRKTIRHPILTPSLSDAQVLHTISRSIRYNLFLTNPESSTIPFRPYRLYFSCTQPIAAIINPISLRYLQSSYHTMANPQSDRGPSKTIKSEPADDVVDINISAQTQTSQSPSTKIDHRSPTVVPARRRSLRSQTGAASSTSGAPVLKRSASPPSALVPIQDEDDSPSSPIKNSVKKFKIDHLAFPPSSSSASLPASKPKAKAKRPANPRPNTVSSPSYPLAPPPDWEAQYALIQATRARLPPAPVDTMGCSAAGAEDGLEPGPSGRKGRFAVLISLMLSSQTKGSSRGARSGKLIVKLSLVLVCLFFSCLFPLNIARS